MMKRSLLLFFIFFLAVVSCTMEEGELIEQKETVEVNASHPRRITMPHEEGSVVVEFSDEMVSLIEADVKAGTIATKATGMRSALDELGIISMERVFPDAGEWEPRTRAEGLHKFYSITYDASHNVEEAIQVLDGIDGVLETSPKLKVRLRGFNDPGYSSQWHYVNKGSNNFKEGADINVQKVWDNYTTGNSDVIVCVVDEGVALSHPDLQDNVIDARVGGSWNYVPQGSGNSKITPGSHGTHVAGTIAAVNNNGIGVCGIAGGDKAAGVGGVKILSHQIFEGEYKAADDSNTAKAIKDAADKGAVISQNSWGYYADADDDYVVSEQELQEYKSWTIPSYMKSAIDYFIKYAGCDNSGKQLPGSPMKGGVVFFAAGNEDIDYDVICDYEPVVAVGSFGPTGTKAPYSNYGSWVDIAAPGGDQSRWSQAGIYSTYINDYTGAYTYAYLEGTSMACPHASGVAALLVSYFGGEGFTSTMLKDALLKGAVSYNFGGNKKIGPKLDAYSSFQYAIEHAGGEIVDHEVVSPVVTDFKLSVEDNTMTVSTPLQTDSKGNNVSSYLVVAGTSRSEVANLSPKDIPSSLLTKTINVPEGATVGTTLSTTFKSLSFATTYYVVVFSKSAGNFSKISEVKSISTPVNNPPKISLSSSSPGMDQSGNVKAKFHEEILMTFKIVEPDGHNMTVDVSVDSPFVTNWNPSTGECTIARQGASGSAGNYPYEIVATDSFGESTSFSGVATVQKNSAPRLTALFDNMIIHGLQKEVEMNVVSHFEDSDGEVLTFSAAPDDKAVLHSTVSNSGVLTLTSTQYGMTKVTVTAVDCQLAALGTMMVLVRPEGVEVDVYPTNVTSTLSVRTGEHKTSTTVMISNPTGRVVFEGTAEASAFDPYVIDMSKTAPGIYTVKVECEGKEHTFSVVKR